MAKSENYARSMTHLETVEQIDKPSRQWLRGDTVIQLLQRGGDFVEVVMRSCARTFAGSRTMLAAGRRLRHRVRFSRWAGVAMELPQAPARRGDGGDR